MENLKNRKTQEGVMYKKQMSFQKLVCYSALAAGLIVFIYSLGIMTDLYDCLSSTMLDPSDLS